MKFRLDSSELYVSRNPVIRRMLIVERIPKSDHFNTGHYERVVGLEGYDDLDKDFLDILQYDLAYGSKELNCLECPAYSVDK
jgi:hypothetical protein